MKGSLRVFLIILSTLSLLSAAVHRIKFFEYRGTYDSNEFLPGGEEEFHIVITKFDYKNSLRYLGFPLMLTTIDAGLFKRFGDYQVIAIDSIPNRVVYIDYKHRRFAAFKCVEPIAATAGKDKRIYVICRGRNGGELHILTYHVGSDYLENVRTIKRRFELFNPVDISYHDNGTPGYIDDDYLVVVSMEYTPHLYKFDRQGNFIKEVPIRSRGYLLYGEVKGVVGKKIWYGVSYTNTNEIHLVFKKGLYARIKGDVFSGSNYSVDTVYIDSGAANIEVNDFGDVFIMNPLKNCIYHVSNGRLIGKLRKDDGSTWLGENPSAVGILGDQIFIASYWFGEGISRYVFVSTLDDIYLYGPDSVIATRTSTNVVFKISEWSRVRYEVVGLGGTVYYRKDEIESPGYHFRTFDGVAGNFTLPDGTYKLRIIVYSLYGDRNGIDPPDTGEVYVRVCESNRYQVLMNGYAGGEFFHDSIHSITRIIDTSESGSEISKIALYNKHAFQKSYWNGVLQGDREYFLKPRISTNDDVVVFALKGQTGIIYRPLEYNDTLLIKNSGTLPDISPEGTKLIYYDGVYVVKYQWIKDSILWRRRVPNLKYLSYHPYHDWFIYTNGKQVYEVRGDTQLLIYEADSGNAIVEVDYHPDGKRMVFLEDQGSGKRLVMFDKGVNEAIEIERGEGIDGAGFTPDGRYMTYHYKNYVMGYPIGTVKKEPLILIKSPKLGEEVEQSIVIKGWITNNISPVGDSIYAHLQHFRVEWGYGEFPDSFTEVGVHYPNGNNSEIVNNVVAVISPGFRSDTIMIHIVAYSVEGDSSERYFWVNYSPVKFTVMGYWEEVDEEMGREVERVDPYFDYLYMDVEVLDTTGIKILGAEIKEGAKIIYVERRFSSPIEIDTCWLYSGMYDLRDNSGKFLEDSKYYTVRVKLSKGGDTAYTLKKWFRPKHFPLMSTSLKATYPEQSRHLEAYKPDISQRVDTLYLAYLSKNDVMLAKGIRWYETYYGDTVYLDSMISVEALTQNRKLDYYVATYLDTVHAKLYIVWGEEGGVVNLYQKDLREGRAARYHYSVGCEPWFTDIVGADSMIYIAYAGKALEGNLVGVIGFDNDRLKILRRWVFPEKVYPPDLIRFKNRIYIGIHHGNTLEIYGLTDNVYTNISEEIGATGNGREIVNYNIGITRGLMSVSLVLFRKDTTGLLIVMRKDTLLNTYQSQIVDSACKDYVSVLVDGDWLNATGYPAGDSLTGFLYRWDPYTMAWYDIGYPYGMLYSLFRNGPTFGGVGVDYPDEPVKRIVFISPPSGFRKDRRKTHREEFVHTIKYFFTPPYPNPIYKNAYFKFGLPEKGEVRFEIFRADGRKVREIRRVYTSGIYVLSLKDIVGRQEIPTGIYFYKFQYRSKQNFKKESGKLIYLK